jgi:hypothetical protein
MGVGGWVRLHPLKSAAKSIKITSVAIEMLRMVITSFRCITLR